MRWKETTLPRRMLSLAFLVIEIVVGTTMQSGCAVAAGAAAGAGAGYIAGHEAAENENEQADKENR
jgi:hypothetical protein